MIDGGYILQPRCFDGSDASKMPPVTREIWFYILRKVNHSDNKQFKRGQNFFSYSDIQQDLCWYSGYRKNTYSKPQITKSIRRLREGNMVETMKATRGLIITICNYDYYQNPKNYESNNEGNMKETRKKRSGRTINKNERMKECNNTPLNPPKGGNKEIIFRVVDYLNRKTNSSYKPEAKVTVKHINARIKEGFSPEDFKAVIDFKCAQWLGDADKQEFLRPKTLFCSNFEGYLNASRRKQSKINNKIETQEDIDRELKDALS